jgi:hypothetical protein
MKLKRILTTILYFIIFFSISDLLFAQKNASEIVSENYKFTFTIPQKLLISRRKKPRKKMQLHMNLSQPQIPIR